MAKHYIKENHGPPFSLGFGGLEQLSMTPETSASKGNVLARQTVTFIFH